MSKTIALTNALVASPAFNVAAIALNGVAFSVADGAGNQVELRIPRSQAARIASTINGIVNAQVFEELENAERAGTITEAQARSLARKRETRDRTTAMNAERKAAAEARKAGKPVTGGKLKAVA